MQFKQLDIPGVIEIIPNILKDDRGAFVKIFHQHLYQEANISAVDFREEYFSISQKNVLRGMHFQLPPDDHEKLVYCVDGVVQDVLLDLRRGSPMFGQAISIELSDQHFNALYIPKGVAHGFLTLSEKALLIYKTTTVYSAHNDKSLHYSSCGNIWKNNDIKPLLSNRDTTASLLKEFESPFVYE